MEPSVKYFIGTGAAVVVVVLCLCWPVYYSVAQDNDAAPDSSLTVGKCIDANDTSGGPAAEVLIKEDIIEEDLLQTKVTNGMCEDMLEQTSDSTPVRSLIVAQNYMQEIKFIEEAMRRAGGEADANGTDAKGTDHHFLADEPLASNRTLVAVVQSTPKAQYKGNGNDNGLEDRIGVTPIRKQAAAAANVGEDSDATFRERYNQKKAAATEAGASAPEAAAGAHCGLEVDVSDEELGRPTSGMYKIQPQIPEEMRHRETKQAGLLVTPLTKEGFQNIRQTHRVIAKIGESNIGCVDLADQMSAKLIAEELHIEQRHTDDIRKLSPNQDTRWSWDITTSQTGEHNLSLELGYTTLREGSSEVRWITKPRYEGAIKVTRPAPPEQPWWRRSFERILEFFRT